MRRMIIVVMLLSSTLGLGIWSYAEDGEPSKVTADDLKLMQGEWQVVALEVNGEHAPLDALKEMRWFLKGSELTFTDGGEDQGGTATVKLDPSKIPKHFDAVSLAGPNKDKPILGI